MGAGPYRFHSFENNVVTLVANDFFYKGAPHVKKIKLPGYQYCFLTSSKV